MKKMEIKKIFVIFTLITTMAFVSTSCSPSATSPTDKNDVTLTVWVNGKDSYIGPDEQKKPQDQWYISQAFKRFEAQNPGVKINLVVQPDAQAAHQLFKTAAMAGNAPDIANLWAGQFIFALKDVILPLNNLIPESDKTNIKGWNTTTIDFKDGKDILGYPAPDNQMCFFLYNKKVIADCGLDYDKNPPRTMTALMDDMKTIKDKGYTPLVADEGGSGYPYYFFYIAGYWWAQQTPIANILAESTGAKKFVDDAGLRQAIDDYSNIYKDGYMNPDPVTSADSWNKFLQGKVALYPACSTQVNDAVTALGAENVGAILPPDTDGAKITNSLIGGPGQSFVVSKNSKNPEMAVKLLSFLSSKEEVLNFYKVQAKVPVRTDITQADMGVQPGSVVSKLFDWSQNYVFWIDNSIPPSVVDNFTKYIPTVLVGKMSTDDFLKLLDDSVAQNQ